MEPPRHRAFFVIRRLAKYPDPEPEAPGNPHKQRKKQENETSLGGWEWTPGGCAFVLGLQGEDAAGRRLVAVFSAV